MRLRLEMLHTYIYSLVYWFIHLDMYVYILMYRQTETLSVPLVAEPTEKQSGVRHTVIITTAVVCTNSLGYEHRNDFSITRRYHIILPL